MKNSLLSSNHHSDNIVELKIVNTVYFISTDTETFNNRMSI